MAREAYRSLYGDLLKLKDTSLLDDPAGGTGDDNEMFQLLLSVSEAIEQYTNRHFYTLTTTKLFDGSGTTRLLVPDLLSVTSLKSDDDEDKTFETTWATGDYWLAPYNAEPTKHWGHAYTSIEVRDKGTQSSFTKAEQIYQVIGAWGYRDLVEASGSLINDAAGMDAAEPTTPYDGGGAIAIGQTIRIDTEDMLVTADSGTILTVTRALNGTTVATHADNAVINILRWPLGIERATLITTARIWSRAPFFEPFYVDSDLDTDVRFLLDPYRRLTV